jgi:hypothetical protein
MNYYCSKCHKIIQRDSEAKRIKSMCDATGETVFIKRMKDKIKLTEVWISELSPEPKIYKTKGYYEELNKIGVFIYYNQEGRPTILKGASNDPMEFKTEQEAIAHNESRRVYWENYYKEQVELKKKQLAYAEGMVERFRGSL